MKSSSGFQIVRFRYSDIEPQFSNVVVKMARLYSGGSNSKHSNTESIRKPNVSKFGFRIVRKQNGVHFVLFSNGPDHSKTEIFKMAALA